MEQVYRGRKPKASPLWQCLSHHFDEFLEAYEERYQPRYGFLRPIIPEVVEKFLECGDLARGFARIRAITARRTACWPSPARAALRQWKRTLSASDSGPTPRRATSDFLSVGGMASYNEGGGR